MPEPEIKVQKRKWLAPPAEGAAGELLADTEAGKNLAQQIVRRELACNG